MDMPFTGGFRLAALGVALTLALMMAGLVLAGTFDSEPSPATYEAQLAPNISFNLNNTDPMYNITNITIIFPGVAVFIEGSDYTGMTGFSISNTTSSFMWGNTTPEGILENGTETYLNLSFYNMTAPGNYSFEINATFTDSSYHNETHNVTIVDTTPPSGITLISPENASWTNISWIFVNLSYTELNPYNCIYQNGTGDNTTNTSTSSPCYINVSGYAEGSWTYYLWVNDTSGNAERNGTYNLSYDGTDPGLNSLGLFYQGGNVSGKNITERDNVTISLNITDALSGVNSSAVWANVYNESDGLVVRVELGPAGGDLFNGTWYAATDNNGSGEYTIEVNGTDNAGNTPDPGLTTTLKLLGAPDLTVTGVEWSSSNSNPGWPTSSDDITLNITIMNIGDDNFTGTFNVTTDIDGSEKNRSNLAYLNESEYAVLNLTFTSGNFSTNKYYAFTIELDPENVVNESSETNNTYAFGFNLGYNISLVKFNATAWPSVGVAFPDSNVTVNISVEYGNGSGVTGLVQDELDVWNKWGVNNWNTSDRVYSFSAKGGGYYTFTFNTQELYSDSGGNKTRARFGDNYLNVSAAKGSYSGRSLLLYNITAPDLEVSIDDDEIDDINLAGASYKEVDMNVTVTNNGNAKIYNIEIEDDSSDNWVLVHDDFMVDHGDNYTFEAELRVEETHSYGYAIYLFVYGNDTLDNRYKGYTREKVEVRDTGSGEDGEDGNGGTGGGGLEFELTITDWEDEIDCYPGGANTTTVEVKNTGDVTVVAKVSFTCDGSILDDADVYPTSKSIAVGSTEEFDIDIDIDNNAEIGEYDCTVKAYVSSSEDDYDTETIVLRVLATEEEAEEINQSCLNISAAIEDLFGRFSAINPALVNDTNRTRVKDLLDDANSTLQDILDAIAGGDYITAHELIESLEASLESTEDALAGLELEQTMGGGAALSETWFWAIIITVVVMAVAFVAYLFFPQKGHAPGKSLMDSLKETTAGIGKAKGKEAPGPSAYAEGYDRQATAGYSYKKGPAGKAKSALSKIREKLRRKKKPQKEVTQYFTNPSSNIINYS
jgi:hypothetical protein